MGIQTHLGPQLLGTVKNNNPLLVTSNNPLSTSWPTFLGTGQTNGVRNLGVGDGTQFGSFVIGSSSFPTSQTGVSIPGSGTGQVTGSNSVTFYPGVYTLGPSGQQQFQPIVMPAGSYISAVVFDITTQFANGGTIGSTTAVNLAVNAIGAPGTTYATAVNLVNHASTTNGSGAGSFTTTFGTVQRNQVGSGSGLTLAAAGVPYFVNTGATDTIIQCVLSITTGNGSTPTLTAGAGYLGINYTIRNSDGSWYPQTPTSPISNPPVITY